jgi:hypothetical protein
MGGGALKGRRSLDAILAQSVAVKLSTQLAARCASPKRFYLPSQ